MNRKILVTGATGKVGSAVVNVLHDHGLSAVAAIRSPQKSAFFEHQGIGTQVMDFEDPLTIEKALQHIAEVFLVMPLNQKMPAWTRTFAREAKAARIRHVVRLSVMGADIDSNMELCKIHGEADQALAESGLSYTILRPNMFMQNFVAYHGDSIRKQHAFYLPHAEAKMSMVDVRDIAFVAATVLENPTDHHGKIYELTGPQAISNTDVAVTLSEVAHERIGYIPVDDNAAREASKNMGLDPWMTNLLEDLNKSIRSGHLARITSTVEDVTGHKPHSFGDFAHDFSTAWK